MSYYLELGARCADSLADYIHNHDPAAFDSPEQEEKVIKTCEIEIELCRKGLIAFSSGLGESSEHVRERAHCAMIVSPHAMQGLQALSDEEGLVILGGLASKYVKTPSWTAQIASISLRQKKVGGGWRSDLSTAGPPPLALAWSNIACNSWWAGSKNENADISEAPLDMCLVEMVDMKWGRPRYLFDKIAEYTNIPQ